MHTLVDFPINLRYVSFCTPQQNLKDNFTQKMRNTTKLEALNLIAAHVLGFLYPPKKVSSFHASVSINGLVHLKSPTGQKNAENHD